MSAPSTPQPSANPRPTPKGGRAPVDRLGPAVSLAFRAALGVVVLLVAFGIFRALVETAPTIEPREDENGAMRLPVIEPRTIAIQRDWTGFGTAEATDRANVPARVTATVVELPARIEAGRTVTAGELLVRLDDSDFRRQVETATAAIAELTAQLDRLAIESDAAAERSRLAARDLEIAQEDERRVRRATEQEAARQRELDQAIQRSLDAERGLIAAREAVDGLRPRRAQLEALLSAQRSMLRRAEDDVARCAIRSPIDGVLQSVDVRPGESVMAGERVARVVSLARIEVPLRLPASARREVGLGDPVRLFDDGRGARVWEAEIVRIAPQDDPATRTMTVFAELVQDPESAELLPPGRFVQASVASGVPVRRVAVPRRAVRADRVLVVREGVVRSLEVTIDFAFERVMPEFGVDDSMWLALREPPPPGDLVVVDAGRRAVPGQPAVAVMPNGLEVRAEAVRSEPATVESTSP